MKKIVLHITMLLFTWQLFAQEDGFAFDGSRHEFSVGAGFGHSGLQHERFDFRFGGNLNFGYAFNINETFAIFSGLELNFFTARWSSPGFTDTILWHNPAFAQFGDDRMLYVAETNGIRESQRATYLYIPLMVRAQFPIGLDMFYAKGGIKFGIPIMNSYHGHIGEIRTSGYSFYANQWWINDPDFGYSTFTDNDLSGRLDLWFSAALSLELGYIYRFPRGQIIRFGLFTNFGLNNVLRNPNPHMVTRNPYYVEVPRIASYTGRFESLRPRTFGIMVRFGL
ncbi:MAG: hypothetical protein FWC98_02485 [Bacteroidales bacterium]|nr:hypothetical protein [Bacteroidales bacterium]